MLPRIYIIPNSSPTKQADESECKKTKLSLQQKGRVIAAIKKHPVIWDRNHPSRCQRTILKAAWESVAKETKFDVESCKIAWRSIKDSKRYYSRKAKSNAELDYSSDDSFAKHSQFMDEMKFLDQTPSNYSEDRAMSPTTGNMSQEDYGSSCSIRSDSHDTRPADSINEFEVVEVVDYREDEEANDNSYTSNLEPPRKICVRKDMVSSKTSLDTSTPSASKSQTKASYSFISNTNVINGRKKEENVNDSFLNHLDSILRKLPNGSAEKLQAKIMAMAYEELLEYRKDS